MRVSFYQDYVENSFPKNYEKIINRLLEVIDEKRIGRSSFYYLVNEFAIKSKEVVSLVDYIKTLFVAKPIKVLQENTDALVLLLEKAQITKYLAVLYSFLKNFYNNYAIMATDNCATHELQYILIRELKFDDRVRSHKKNPMSCAKYKFYSAYAVI